MNLFDMKPIFRVASTLLFGLTVHLTAQAQKAVPPEIMQKTYETVQTPYKYGLVLTPENDNCKLDSPTVFRMEGKWYMTYVRYDGRTTTDGTGYETWLAESDNLLEWRVLGPILSFKSDGWDAAQRGGYLALTDYRWDGNHRPKKYDGYYWLSYIGGATQGYEAGQLNIGLARTKQPANQVHEWESFDGPVLTPKDPDALPWESYTLYKSSVLRVPTHLFGSPFVMFYNAKGDAAGRESIGIAVSDDMMHWKRYPESPVLDHPQGRITGDAQIVKMGELYVMFYFGAFWEGKQAQAFNRFACSYDLKHWTDWTGDDLIAPSEPYDNLFAHKSFVLHYKGVVYHFYCAVNDRDQRGIAVATSRDMGSSSLQFDR